MRAKERILDACDIEAFFLCDDIEEGKRLGMALMGLGFPTSTWCSARWQGQEPA